MPFISETDLFLHFGTAVAVAGATGAGIGYLVHELTHRKSLAREEKLRTQRVEWERAAFERMNTGAQKPVPWPYSGNTYGLGPQPIYAPAAVPLPAAAFVDSDTTLLPRHTRPVSPSPLVDYSTRLGFTPPSYDWTARTPHTAVDLRPVTD